MYVKSGKRCTLLSNNSAGGNTGVEVTQCPVNGSIEVNGFSLAYTPKAGFVGSDSFGYVRHALDHRNNQPIKFMVTVAVTVEK